MPVKVSVAVLGVVGLCILSGAAAGGATYLFFGHYWYRLRQLHKDD
jgi:hypothetical protein